MKVIIAGGRDFLDYDTLVEVVESTGFEITEVVCGEAPGADYLGRKWAETNGIPVKSFPADWTQYGKAAGPIRNQQMANYADALIAFPTTGPGTLNMINLAERKGLKLHIHISVSK